MPSSVRYAHIDALRAVAALLVMWLHTSETLDDIPGTYATAPHDWAVAGSFGVVGVALFFLISGFVIPSSLRSEGSRRLNLRDFVIRRFFRLYPLFWLSVPLGFLSTGPLPFGRREFVANLTMLPHALGYRQAEGLYWTLEIELGFYVLCAVLFAFGLLRREPVVAALAAALTLVRFIYWIAVPGLPAIPVRPAEWCNYLGLMFLGALLRRWHDGALTPTGRVTTAAIAGIWLLVLPAAALMQGSASGNYSAFVQSKGHTIATAIFVLGVFVWPVRARWLAWLGTTSYSIYLLHPIVFHTESRIVRHLPFQLSLPLPVYMLAAFAVTIWFSTLTWRWIEAPMIALGARLTRRREDSSGRVPPTLHVPQQA